MLKGFICYSHTDHALRDALVRQLKDAEEKGYAKFWVDKDGNAKDTVSTQIEEAIQQSDVFVLLISSFFNNSPYIRTKELPLILQKVSKDGGLIIPVQAQPCELPKELSDRNIVPKGQDQRVRALTRWGNREHACHQAYLQTRTYMQRHFDTMPS